MASFSGTLYTGMTNDLEVRVWDHKHGTNEGFTKRYQCTRLVYYEEYGNPWDAIDREKQIKGWSRKKKEALIRKMNPKWKDLSAGWYERDPSTSSRHAAGLRSG